MFRNGQRVEEDVVLRTQSQTLANLFHVESDVKSVDPRCARRWRQKPYQPFDNGL